MNLTKLFDAQRKLDKHIMSEHPELKGQDNLDWKILALQVELGECANEWRGFKKWSNDQKPRLADKCRMCSGYGEGYFSGEHWTGKKELCTTCEGSGIDEHSNPLLEEYVDGLHFILSIGLELGFEKHEIVSKNAALIQESIIYVFSNLISHIGVLNNPKCESFENYNAFFNGFILLGFRLGFTWEQIEQAYFDKNKINHERQESGY